MLAKSVLWILTTQYVQAQLNGDFWWLNPQLNNHYKNAHPPPPKFEVLSEFDNDESAKIVFRDNNFLTKNEHHAVSEIKNKDNQNNAVHNFNDKIVWPDEVDKVMYNKVAIQNNDKKYALKTTTENIPSHDKRDDFAFNINETENVIFNVSTEHYNAKNITKFTNDYIESAILFNDDRLSSASVYKKDESKSQNICTYMQMNECNFRKGFVYINPFKEHVKNESHDSQRNICCILPLSEDKDNDVSSQIFFPDTLKKYKRVRRSSDERKKDLDNNQAISLALKQRNILLQRKFSNPFHTFKHASATRTKVLTPDDEYEDPYSNIKNSDFRNSDLQNKKQSSTKYDYNSEEYKYEDYEVELPKPGLVGVYSDHDEKPTSWPSFNENEGSFYGDDDEYGDEDEQAGTSFGYSTIDPRRETKSNQKIKPVKLKTNSGEITYGAESQTIHFESNPDFKVLQDFKLLNLMQKKSRIQSKNKKKNITTESVISNESEETTVISAEVIDDNFFKNQIFNGCGKHMETVEKVEQGILMGDARIGSQPWVALLVLTKRLQTTLVYATLIHPRAAITAGDCVDGVLPGEVTLIAGLWNLNEKSRSKSRIVTVHTHPRYRPGDVTNNLAILHWTRPLRLSVNVQPACLAEPRMGDNCKFFGWGRYDEFRPKPRWQRASVNACRVRGIPKRGLKPSETFCASVQLRSVVTGIGGSLICDVDGHSSAVGVIVSQDNGYILSRTRDWTQRTINKLVAG